MLKQRKLSLEKWNSDNLNCRNFNFIACLNWKKKMLDVVTYLPCLSYIIKYNYLSWGLEDWTMVIYYIVTFICIHDCVVGKIKKWLCELETRMTRAEEGKNEKKNEKWKDPRESKLRKE